jgi:hypothetical protein
MRFARSNPYVPRGQLRRPHARWQIEARGKVEGLYLSDFWSELETTRRPTCFADLWQMLEEGLETDPVILRAEELEISNLGRLFDERM